MIIPDRKGTAHSFIPKPVRWNWNTRDDERSMKNNSNEMQKSSFIELDSRMASTSKSTRVASIAYG